MDKIIFSCIFAFSVYCLLAAAFNAGAQVPSPTPLNPKLPSLFVIGDSTANNNANGGLGWGDPFKSFFDPSKVNVVNRARAGRSSRTFYTEGLWEKVLTEIKAGDVVLIQFGHNDGGPIEEKPARGSLPGLGEESKEITKPDGTKETVHTFGWYMRKFVADTRSKGATPVILSLTVRNIWKDGKVERGSGQFSAWAAMIAKMGGVDFIDLTNLVADRYEQLGEQNVATLLPDRCAYGLSEKASRRSVRRVQVDPKLFGLRILFRKRRRGSEGGNQTTRAAPTASRTGRSEVARRLSRRRFDCPQRRGRRRRSSISMD